MHVPDIELHEPRTIREACKLLNIHCDEAKVLAGGTDLIVDLKQGRITGVRHLVSLRGIENLGEIEKTDEGIRIGALVTLSQAARDTTIRKHFPVLTETIGMMAAHTIRNMATVAGNIAGAVPSSDLAPVFIVAEGEAILSDGDSERRARIEDYILGPRETVCGDSEILTHLVVPPPGRLTGISYQKFMLRDANALAVAGVAAQLTLSGNKKISIKNSCIAMTAVAPKPVIAREACAYLAGKAPSGDLFSEAAKKARAAALPITDIRGTAEYRSDLVEVLTYRALEEAYARISKELD